MSAAAIGMMVFVLIVVWGGAGLTLWLIWRQERRRAVAHRERRSAAGDGASPPARLT